MECTDCRYYDRNRVHYKCESCNHNYIDQFAPKTATTERATFVSNLELMLIEAAGKYDLCEYCVHTDVDTSGEPCKHCSIMHDVQFVERGDKE